MEFLNVHIYSFHASKDQNLEKSKWGIPERDISSLCAMGQGSGQMGELSARRRRPRRHLEIQVDIQAKKLFLEFPNWIFDSYERSQDFETAVLHRISSRVYLAEWFGLGSHFEKKYIFGLDLQKWDVYALEHFLKMVSAPNVTGSLGGI